MMDAQGKLDLASLEPGLDLEAVPLDLNSSTVARYLESVEYLAFDGRDGPVPGMAVAALALRSLLARLRLPPGTLHTSQELQFHREPRASEPLTCRTRVLQKSRRSRLTILSIELRVANHQNQDILLSRSTIMVSS